MNDIQLAAQLEALKLFAEETDRQIRELQNYIEAGILGDEMRNNMELAVATRYYISQARFEKLRVVMDEKGYEFE